MNMADNRREELRNNLIAEIKDVDSFTKKTENETNDYRNSLLYHKTCATNCSTEEEALLQVYRNFILE